MPAAAPDAMERQALLLEACGIVPEGGWQDAGLSQKLLSDLRRSNNKLYTQYRAQAVMARLLTRALLADVLRSRVLEQLMAADTAAELERLAKIIERLPERQAASTGEDTKGCACLLPDASGLSLAETLAEARQLVGELEQEAGHGS
jgi:hypothetical protein